MATTNAITMFRYLYYIITRTHQRSTLLHHCLFDLNIRAKTLPYPGFRSYWYWLIFLFFLFVISFFHIFPSLIARRLYQNLIN